MSGFTEDNTPAYDPPMTKAAFLRWVQRQERRHELKDGRVIMHPGGSQKHAHLIGRFVATLSVRLDPDNWAVIPTDFAVEIGEDIRYPEVLVHRLAGTGSELSTSRPVVLVEVLSPSSIGTDMTVKVAEYTSLASLEAYIVASQDQPILWVWQRNSETREFPAKPEQIDGREQTLGIAALGLSLPHAELYRGILAA